MENLKLFRLIHKNARVGAIVIGRKVTVYPHKPHQRYHVEVDGVDYIDFCGASFICELDEETSKDYLEKVKNDVLKMERV